MPFAPIHLVMNRFPSKISTNKKYTTIQNLQKGKKTGNRQGLEEWLDNQDVCMLLNISPGKLLSLRRSGAIAYSRIDRKIYYKRKDIQSFMEQELKKQKTE